MRRLAGRIAAKDAVRDWLWRRGADHIFPVEIQIVNDDAGRPVIVGCPQHDLSISIAHKGSVAVAMVHDSAAVGVDIETIEPRTERFLKDAFTADERALLPATQRDIWATRFWCAKEAAGKAAGTGLDGSPRQIVISAVDGERVCANGRWVDTTEFKGHIVGWTVESE